MFFGLYDFSSNFTSMWYQYFLRNVWRDFRLSMSALTTVIWKSFNGKFTAEIDFLTGYLILPLLIAANVYIESLKSLHTLFEVFGSHAGEI